MKKRIKIIGSGFSSLSAACYLAQQGHDVSLFEKNKTVGGRARQLKKDGFTFDIGPTWYWMPDVFERFFADFKKKPADYYSLTRLSPAYRVYFGPQQFVAISDNLQQIISTFEEVEPGSGARLQQFMNEAQKNYEIAIKDLVYRPGVSALELVSVKTIARISQFFGTISKDIRRKFKDPRLISILEFPVLFLGAKPSDTPSFYNFMNHADFALGTWHPSGGMYSVVKAVENLALGLGVQIFTDSNVEKIEISNGEIKGLTVNGEFHDADIIVSGADYHHTETLLPKNYRQYSEKYWQRQTFAPSALLFYVGLNKKVKDISHHTLFFDVDFEAHANAIYDNPRWPEKPLFYASFPSVTDQNVAPENNEAAIFLIPLAPGIEDTAELRNLYFEKIVSRLEALTNQKIRENVVFSESYCVNDFVEDYNSYKGNAYGLANTLFQTAFLRPKLKSKKVRRLYFTGQLTVPGPGVPPALISGKLVAELIAKQK